MCDRACPLCAAASPQPYYRDAERVWLRCATCDLVFVPPAHHLGPAAEKAQYDLHHNDASDLGYRRFLSRLADPMLARLPPGSAVLDFGSGPGPTLSVMLAEAGHRVAIYDPFYAPDRAVLRRVYRAVTATEVIEHFAHPGAELAALWRAVEPGGWLGVMTRFRPTRDRFAGWHYRREPTHIALYSEHTLRWIAAWLAADLTLVAPDVGIFEKLSNSTDVEADPP